MSEFSDKFFITTAIAYTSQKPHIGNNYDHVVTDAIARYMRLKGRDVFFLTGTDEHGQKIEDVAKKEGLSPKEHVDKISGIIKNGLDVLNISYDKFIRTTDDYHEKAVRNIFKKLYEQGDIYKGDYEGRYCVPCESFWTESQLKDGNCPDCGREVSAAKEEAYFLKLGKYQEQLEEYWEQNQDFALPKSRRNEMLNNFIKPGLKDLCVSRTTFKWGVTVDFDEKHVVYVWIDALANYATALGYDPANGGIENQPETFRKYWGGGADVHVIGKDILRFHTIYWPIILMALGVPLPKKVFGHPWLLVDKNKISKSTGNTIYADELIEKYGVDGTRWFLLSEMPFDTDGNITFEAVTERYNSDLANTIGNLVNRTAAMTNKYFGGNLKNVSANDAEHDLELKNIAQKAFSDYSKNIEDFRLADACEAVMTLGRACNKYIDLTTPWILAKNANDESRLSRVLSNLCEGIRFIGIMLLPLMPKTADYILKVLKTDDSSFASLETFTPLIGEIGVCEPLFVRIADK